MSTTSSPAVVAAVVVAVITTDPADKVVPVAVAVVVEEESSLPVRHQCRRCRRYSSTLVEAAAVEPPVLCRHRGSETAAKQADSLDSQPQVWRSLRRVVAVEPAEALTQFRIVRP